MFSSAGSTSKPRPPPVEVPTTIATDDDEGDTDANTLLAGEAIRTLGASHANTPSTQAQQPSTLVRSTSETVLAMPDHSEQTSTVPDQGVDNQPLLEWLQSSSHAQPLQRRRSEQQSTPLWSPPSIHRSTSETADAFVDSSHQKPTVNRAATQPFYGMEPRQPVRRESTPQLLTNMRGPMRKPYRQQSLLSRGSPPVANTGRRCVSHDHETAHSAHVQEMMEMSSNPLSRIASDAPESSGGSILVEVSPDSYEPLQAAIAEMPGVLKQLPSMLEEEPEVQSEHLIYMCTCVCLRPQPVYLPRMGGCMCERLKDYDDLMRVVHGHMHVYEAQIKCPASSDVMHKQLYLAHYSLCPEPMEMSCMRVHACVYRLPASSCM